VKLQHDAAHCSAEINGGLKPTGIHVLKQLSFLMQPRDKSHGCSGILNENESQDYSSAVYMQEISRVKSLDIHSANFFCEWRCVQRLVSFSAPPFLRRAAV
jgi:hypothetical protein